MKGLTEKQQQFVEAYCGPSKGNATDAARRAGYSGGENSLAVQGAANIRNPKVARAIEEMNAHIRSKAIATAEEVQEFLTATMRGEECRSPIVTMAGVLKDPETGDVLTAPPEAKDRVKAATELARMRGYHPPKETKLEVTGVPQVVLYLPDNGRGR